MTTSTAPPTSAANPTPTNGATGVPVDANAFAVRGDVDAVAVGVAAVPAVAVGVVADVAEVVADVVVVAAVGVDSVADVAEVVADVGGSVAEGVSPSPGGESTGMAVVAGSGSRVPGVAGGEERGVADVLPDDDPSALHAGSGVNDTVASFAVVDAGPGNPSPSPDDDPSAPHAGSGVNDTVASFAVVYRGPGASSLADVPPVAPKATGAANMPTYKATEAAVAAVLRARADGATSSSRR